MVLLAHIYVVDQASDYSWIMNVKRHTIVHDKEHLSALLNTAHERHGIVIEYLLHSGLECLGLVTHFVKWHAMYNVMTPQPRALCTIRVVTRPMSLGPFTF